MWDKIDKKHFLSKQFYPNITFKEFFIPNRNQIQVHTNGMISIFGIRLHNSFLKKYLEDISPLVGLLIPLFWTSGDVCPGFQSLGSVPCLHVSLPAQNRLLRFTCGVTPVELLVASIRTKPFHPHTCIQA